MSKSTINRRTAIAGTAAAATGALVPASASGENVHPQVKIRALAREMRAALDEDGETAWVQVFPNKEPFSGAIYISSEHPSNADPLLNAVRQYEHECNLYCESGGNYEAMVSSLSVLDNWTEPARTREGAMAAIRHAQEEYKAHGDSPSGDAMIAAVVAYLKGSAA